MKSKIEDYITYRLDKARETLSDAKLLAQNNSWNSCVNRLYYACFYSINALLIKNRLEAKTHNGVRTIFFREFIKAGKLSKDFGKLYSDLFDWRNKGDYSDFVDFNAEIVNPLLVKVEEFIKTVEDVIKNL